MDLERAYGLHQAGRLDEAEAIYRAVMARQPHEFNVLYLLAVLSAQKGRLQEALELMEGAVKVAPDRPDAFFNRGIFLENLSRPEEALASYDRAVQLRPDYADAFNNRGALLGRMNRLDEALASYDRALMAQPASMGALLNRGVLLGQLGRFEEALTSFERALQIQPDFPEALRNRGVALARLSRPEAALASFDRALELRPDYPEGMLGRARILDELGRLDEALASYDRLLALSPDLPDALLDRGVVLGKVGRLDEALGSLERAGQIRPDHPDTLYNLGVALARKDRLDEALHSYDSALHFSPDHADALFNRSAVLEKFDRLDEALASLDRAVGVRPDHPEQLVNRGIVLGRKGRLDAALADYDRALGLRPDYPEALLNRGVVLERLGRLDDALSAYDRALRLRPDYPEALLNLGALLGRLNRLDDALTNLDRALDQRPDYLDGFLARGIVLGKMVRHEEALACYDRVLLISPDHVGALNNKGGTLREMMRLEEAAQAWQRLLTIDPAYPRARGLLLNTRLLACDWSDREALMARIDAGIGHGEQEDEPWCTFAYSGAPVMQRRCAELLVAERYPSPAAIGVARRYGDSGRIRSGRIRVAWISSDFRLHAVAVLVAELFETLDRSRFELFAISYGPDDSSPMRSRLQNAFEHFIDVRSWSDQETAQWLREKQIDIAVDLTGHTGSSRMGILAQRCAPVQVNWLGFPGTTGAPFFDYILADNQIVPPGSEAFYSEKVVRLPDAYQPNDRKRAFADWSPSRTELGLPGNGIVFCCFNNNFKIQPDVFDVWMRTLRTVETGVLWLLQDNPQAENNLRREAGRRGVTPERLVFAPRLPLARHLARHRLADLFIDTFPYNAHTTASDALWAGVPLVTLLGETFASRVAGSLLKAAGLPELVTESIDDYEALILRLATTPAVLRDLKSKLEANRLSCPLFDTERFARHVEAALVGMHERNRDGLPPQSFDVPPTGLGA